jgi:O-antigen/teichoic acid export membrane protein
MLSAGGMLVSMAGTLCASMVFTRVLPVAEVGIFTLLVLACDMLIYINNFGLYASLPKLVATTKTEERSRFIGSILGFQLLVSVCFGLLIWVLRWLVRDPAVISQNPSWLGLHPYLWLLPLFFLAGTQRETIAGIMAGLNQYGRRSLAMAGAAVADAVLVVALVWWLKGGLLMLLLATLGSYFVSALVLYVGLPEGRRPALRWHHFSDAVTFSWPLYINCLLTFVFQRLDTAIIAALMGPAQVAYYEMIRRLPFLLSRLLNSALVPFLPGVSTRIAQQDSEGASRLVNKTASITAFLSYSAALAILVVQEPLVTVLFSAKYLPAIPVLWLLLTGICIQTQAGLMGLALVAANRPKAITVINIFAALASVGGCFVLIPWFGISGAGFAYLASMAFSDITQTFCARRSGLAIRWAQFFKPHAWMTLALAVDLGTDSVLGRVFALGLFLVLCILTGVMPLAQLKDLGRVFLPSRLWKPL